MKTPPTLALIVAAGRGSRTGHGVPKQYRLLAGMPVLRRSVLAFLEHPGVDMVRVVIHPDDRPLYDRAIGDLPLLKPSLGGATRQESVRRGLDESMGDAVMGRVLIHDAARPLVSAELIARCLAAAHGSSPGTPGVVPALPVVDSLRRGTPALAEEVDRSGLLRVQTPQCFDLATINELHQTFAGLGYEFTDDSAVALAGRMEVKVVVGDEDNFKLTGEEDFARAERLLSSRMTSRTGMGFDVHAFSQGDGVMLAGIRIPHSRSLKGHSDADVVLHAVTDALLGAIGAGDIGDHFPPSDPRWRGADSAGFVGHARALVEARGGRIDHVDVTLICEAPRIGPHRAAMRQSLAGLLRLVPERVSIKATTTEGLGFAGRGEGVAAQAVATVRLPEEP